MENRLQTVSPLHCPFVDLELKWNAPPLQGEFPGTPLGSDASAWDLCLALRVRYLALALALRLEYL